MDKKIGQVVYSKAGRDSGKKFIILKVEDDSYVWICDGDLRRIEKPKKKKIKHLELTGVVIDLIREKLENGQKVTNSEIRKTLEALENEPEQN